MNYLKKSKKPKKTKHQSPKNLHITLTEYEFDDYREQLSSRSELIGEILFTGLGDLSDRQVTQLCNNFMDYIEWSLVREKVIVGGFLPDTLDPSDFETVVLDVTHPKDINKK